MKWRWRLLDSEDSALWKEVLVAKYGVNITKNVNLSSQSYPSFASCWWKHIRDLDGCVDSINWLEEVIVRKVGNGLLTRFWKDVWIGDSPLCFKFPRLFSLSTQKEVCVGEVLKVDGERRWWEFAWRRNLFQWEVDRELLLCEHLTNVRFSNESDVWLWKLDPGNGFSVKSAYEALVEVGQSSCHSEYELKMFSSIWESPAPSKVIAFHGNFFTTGFRQRITSLEEG
jgi:hypothetical protein